MTIIENAEKALDKLLKNMPKDELRRLIEEVEKNFPPSKTTKPPEEYIHIPLLFPHFL